MKYKDYAFDSTTHFYVNIVSVSNSGMTRRMKFYIIHDGQLVNMTPDIADVLGVKLTSDYCVRVKGCGMDMVFSTLCSFASALGEPEPHRLGWTTHYTLI